MGKKNEPPLKPTHPLYGKPHGKEYKDKCKSGEIVVETREERVKRLRALRVARGLPVRKGPPLRQREKKK